MKQLISIVLFLLTLSSLSAQELKNMVCVVRQDFDVNKKIAFQKMATVLSSQGFFSASRDLESRIKNSFGSGFVYQSEKGKFYILTNKHVIGAVNSANLTFSKDSTDIDYSNCEVIRKDDEIDLALIKLPENAKFKKSLTLDTKPIEEGIEVWTAGYPGFGNDPLWQLGKGIISNSNVKNEDFEETKKATIIQHTAQVDPGSSGGPLLVKSTSGNATVYKVVGINTWKAMRRENANFAISANDIQNFVNESLSDTSKKADNCSYKSDSLNKSVMDFLRYIHSQNHYISKYISEDLAVSFNEQTLKKTIKNASYSTRDKLRNGEGVEGLIFLTAERIASKYKKTKDLSLGRIVVSNDEKNADVIIIYKGKEEATTWFKDFNGWKLKSIDIFD
ncbi:MAG TPA: serine protease [Paludibacteraceae bacterium]|nr:serine protease [Paludibacteraceae bacterium]HOU67797.1 serine protease [Paludibacteraceae bacterium]HPH62110.1 serine protease [Paludibacteraceae bacterium]HQF49348.1 serine protease [Paludibacteraceae bacterium]